MADIEQRPLPCAFCEKLPSFHQHKGVWRMHYVYHCETPGCPARHATGFTASGAPACESYAMPDDALSAWNRRPLASQPQAARRIPADMVDGELSVASAIDQVVELFPSADRAAMRTLAACLTHHSIYRYTTPPQAAGAVPEDWRAFLEAIANRCGGHMVDGNNLARIARALLDAATPAPEVRR